MTGRTENKRDAARTKCFALPLIALLVVAATASAVSVTVGRLDGTVRNLNPYLARTTDEFAFGRLVYGDGLVKTDADGTLSLSLAEGFLVSDDSLRWTVRLRSGVTFSDGVALTSRDVETTYRWVLFDRSLHTPAFDAISRIETDGPSRVVFVLRRKQPRLLAEAASLQILPAHFFGDVQPRRWATLPDVGCGSYRVAERTDGEIRFESRAGSHGEAAFDEIVLRPYASTVRLVGAMHRGEVDAIELTDPSFARELHTSNPDVFVSNVRSDFMHPWFFAFNGRRYPFSDPRMRTLLVKAVDRKVIADESFDGLVSVPDGPFDVSLPEHGSRTIDWPYDPSSVVVTLGSWGYYDADGDGVVERGGTPLRFTLLYEAGLSTAETMARALKLSFQSVGVEIIPTGERLVDVWSRMLSGDYDLVLMQLSLPPTADVAYRLFHSAGPNPFGLGSHSVDRAVEALFSSSDRVGAFSRFHVAVAETRQIVFLAQPWRSFVAYSADRTQEVATLLTHYPELVGR